MYTMKKLKMIKMKIYYLILLSYTVSIDAQVKLKAINKSDYTGLQDLIDNIHLTMTGIIIVVLLLVFGKAILEGLTNFSDPEARRKILPNIGWILGGAGLWFFGVGWFVGQFI